MTNNKQGFFFVRLLILQIFLYLIMLAIFFPNALLAYR